MSVYSETPINKLFKGYCKNKEHMTERQRKEEKDRIHWEIKIRLIKAMKYIEDAKNEDEAEEVYKHFLGI